MPHPNHEQVWINHLVVHVNIPQSLVSVSENTCNTVKLLETPKVFDTKNILKDIFGQE